MNIIELTAYINSFKGSELSVWYSADSESYSSLKSNLSLKLYLKSDEDPPIINQAQAISIAFSGYEASNSINLSDGAIWRHQGYKDLSFDSFLASIILDIDEKFSSLRSSSAADSEVIQSEDPPSDFINALNNHKSIISINLSGHNIRSDGAIALADVMQDNFSITSINLDNNNIQPYGTKTLADAIKNHPSLTSINLNNNDVRDHGAKACAEVIKANPHLTSIFLAKNNIEVEGAIALAEAIKISRSLKSINLEKNTIGDEGAIALAEAIKINSSLTSIDLTGNTIEDEGAIALAEAIKSHPSIISIVLSNNPISLKGYTILKDAIDTNSLKPSSVENIANSIINQEELESAETESSSLTANNLSINATASSSSFIFGAEVLESEESFMLGIPASGELSQDTAS